MYAQHRWDGPSLQGAQMIDIWSISSLLTCSKGQEHFFFSSWFDRKNIETCFNLQHRLIKPAAQQTGLILLGGLGSSFTAYRISHVYSRSSELLSLLDEFRNQTRGQICRAVISTGDGGEVIEKNNLVCVNMEGLSKLLGSSWKKGREGWNKGDLHSKTTSHRPP